MAISTHTAARPFPLWDGRWTVTGFVSYPSNNHPVCHSFPLHHHHHHHHHSNSSDLVVKPHFRILHLDGEAVAVSISLSSVDCKIEKNCQRTAYLMPLLSRSLRKLFHLSVLQLGLIVLFTMDKVCTITAFGSIVRAFPTRLCAITTQRCGPRHGSSSRQLTRTIVTPQHHHWTSQPRPTHRIQRHVVCTTQLRTKAFNTRRSLSVKDDDSNHLVDSSLILPPTVRQVLHSAIEELKEASVDEAEDSVFQIMSKVLDLSWESGFRELRGIYHSAPAPATNISTHHHRDNENDALAIRRLTAGEQNMLEDLLSRRKLHEPIQYLMGRWDFLDHVFTVVPPLLCPRPETEELVLHAEASGEQQQRGKNGCNNSTSSASIIRILDVGTGTGCIGISLASRLPQSIVTAIDVEPQAVGTAQENAQRILGATAANSRYQVHLVSAQEYQIEAAAEDRTRFDLVVSNPPYIPSRDMGTLDAVVSQWESHEALCGGEDGMDVIRTIVQQLPYWCHVGADCWMEVDPTHPALLQSWLGQEQDDDVGVIFIESRPDLFGMDRFVHLRVTKEREKVI